MNGWQRLWFAGTVLSLITFALIYPVMEQGKNRSYSYRWSIQRDYDNPACAPFLEKPFNQLQEPPFGDGGTCWHIYTTRQFEDEHEAFMTFDEWAAQDDRDHWSLVAWFCGMMALIVLVISGIVYGLGKTVAWIIKGFRPA